VISGLLDLDASAVLAASEDAEAELREREVDVLRLVLQWADIHSTEPVDGGTEAIRGVVGATGRHAEGASSPRLAEAVGVRA
jgi:hypothetical protein